jgi:hypothetical protein
MRSHVSKIATEVYIFRIVTCMSDSRRGFGSDIGFNAHFNTILVSTLNYSAIDNFRSLQITRAHVKSF